VAIEEVVAGQVFTGRRTSLRAESASQVFAVSRMASEDKDTGHRPGGSARVGHAFKIGGRARARGGFDSRPPPLRDWGSDQRKCMMQAARRAGRAGSREARKTGEPHQSSRISQVFAHSRVLRTGQVFPGRAESWTVFEVHGG
jgi:hypothetical protein